MKKKIIYFYKILKKKYKKPATQWKLWCKRKKNKKEREQVVIEAILTQRTNWKNVEKAIKNLKKENLDSLKSISLLSPRKLESLIKSVGFYKAKSRYLIFLAKFIVKNYKSVENMKKENFQILRKKLLKLKGIGPETADSILLYALNQPVFVIDEYTRRFVKNFKISQNKNYYFLQNLFESNLPRDFRLYQDFHSFIVINGKDKS